MTPYAPLMRRTNRWPWLAVKTCILEFAPNNFPDLCGYGARMPPRKRRFAKPLVAAYISKNMEGKLCG
jgi:hypothetical protein